MRLKRLNPLPPTTTTFDEVEAAQFVSGEGYAVETTQPEKTSTNKTSSTTSATTTTKTQNEPGKKEGQSLSSRVVRAIKKTLPWNDNRLKNAERKSRKKEKRHVKKDVDGVEMTITETVSASAYYDDSVTSKSLANCGEDIATSLSYNDSAVSGSCNESEIDQKFVEPTNKTTHSTHKKMVALGGANQK